MQATPPFADPDALLVVAALRAVSLVESISLPLLICLRKKFVGVHQNLLSTVIGKHGIFAQFGVTAPIAAVLRTLEAGIDVTISPLALKIEKLMTFL